MPKSAAAAAVAEAAFPGAVAPEGNSVHLRARDRSIPVASFSEELHSAGSFSMLVRKKLLNEEALLI